MAVKIYGSNRIDLDGNNETFSIRATADDELNFYKGASTKLMGIDASGFESKPYRPMCSVSYTNGDISTTGAVIVFNNAEVNVGNHYSTSTGRFTAPVAGYYKVDTSILSADDSLLGGVIKKNDADYYKFEYTNPHSQYVQISMAAIIYCAANDYITINQKNGIVYGGGGKYTTMTVYLIG